MLKPSRTLKHDPKRNLNVFKKLGFYLNCEHVLLVYILKQRRKKFCGFKKKFADFQEFKLFTKLKTFKTHF